MWRKIQYNEKSNFFYKISQELDKALVKLILSIFTEP